MPQYNKIKIAIVGGSIAGCACAIVLGRLGFDISVFEKSKEAVIDRGGGIVLPKPLIETLIENDMLDNNFPMINFNERPVLIYDSSNDSEILLTSLITSSIAGVLVNWTNLYRSLLKRVPTDKVQYNANVTKIHRNADGKIELLINNKNHYEFDICFFADGYYSIGRKFLYPELNYEFANYIGWRGVLNCVNSETTHRLVGKMPTYLYEKGSLLLYAIPTIDAKDPDNDYVINWLLYETVDKTHQLYQENFNKARENVIKGKMTKEYISYLHDLAKKYFPEFPRQIILKTKEPFIQAIYDMDIPKYVNEKICLIGDASIIIRPHAGSGATKALQDALALRHFLNKHQDVDKALQEWSVNQIQTAKNVYRVARALGDMFVVKVNSVIHLSKENVDKMYNDLFSQNRYYIKQK